MDKYAAEAAALEEMGRDPCVWLEVAFSGKLKYQKWQRHAARLVASGDRRRTSIASCNGAGKSFLLTTMILWFLTTQPDAKVAVTANTSSQLFDVIWAELQTLKRQLIPTFRDQIEITSDRVFLSDKPNQYAVAKTARRENPEALQGIHARNVLFIIDEASGVDDQVINVASGGFSDPGARVLATGNPMRRQGWFYETHHNPRIAHLWNRMNVSANKKIAAAWDVEFWSERVDDELEEHVRATHGEESTEYRARVCGLFPLEDAETLIPAPLVRSAMARTEIHVHGAEIWGLDVARYGPDRTCLCKRRGNAVIEPIQTRRGLDTMEVAGWVYDEYHSARIKPEYIMVDVIGIGAGVVDRLKQLKLPVVGVNVGERPATRERFRGLRDELWWAAREWFSGMDVYVAEDDQLLKELTAPQYKTDRQSRIVLETKDETKKRIKVSPDLADSFVLTFAGPAAQMASGSSAMRRGPLRRNSPYLRAIGNRSDRIAN